MHSTPSTSPSANGTAAAWIDAHDWAATPLGPRDTWPPALRHALDLILASPQAMCVAWGDALILIPNDAFTPLLGRDPGAVLGRPLQVALPGVWPTLNGPVDDARAGRPQRFKDVPILLERHEGPAQTWWSFSLSRLSDDTGHAAGVMCIAQETTEHVEALRALRESEQRLDALVRSSSEVRFLISADWQRLHELKGGDFIPDTGANNDNWLNDYIPPDGQDAVRAEIERAIRTQSTYAIEHPVRRVDGRVGWAQVRAVPLIDNDGVITAWLGAASDITDRKEAEAAQRDSEARLRDLNATLEDQVAERTRKLRLYSDVVEASTSLICIFDATRRYVAFNPAYADACLQWVGAVPEVGQPVPDGFPADQAAPLHDAMTRTLAGESFSMAMELGLAAHTQRSYELLFTPLRDESDAVIGGFYFGHDVTDRIRSQIELESTHTALRQAQKLEAVGQLTGGVAHDFNNLLTVIKSSSDLLKRPDLPADRRARFIDAISETVDRASRLTGQLLAFSRRQALKPTVFSACDSVRSLADMLETLAGGRIRVIVELSDTPCHVFVDPNQFDTALVNMAVNARDAIEGNGQIVIRVAPCNAIPAVRLHTRLAGQFVAVSIADTGSGIAADSLDTIFEPFYTTKEVGKGTGLGLSQVFGFAKQSGGEIIATSREGEGATFTLYLPRVAAEAQADAGRVAPALTEALADGHDTRVLVVEDNAEVGTSCITALVELGYRPTLSTRAEDALALLQDRPDDFDVVFSDVLMPGMNGIELAKLIRARHPFLPVLLTSGYSAVLAQHGSYGFDLLQKPYAIEQLSQALANAVRSTPQRL
ncbi:hybrid sensor histidine kinase/response regulator [Pigmentiphaga litoralis]|uniref:PAS domain-containing protein n=1 Tax=Pigmentiphaga litoralis TaxID=516702 RepID=UPI0016721B00|nr:PAS domain-containing protein [Pigmentiphaga litoralis]GGX36033.1 hybrid sensor histidine kinase/response regulator [Pigmentiphaga litoralis]